MGDVEKKSLLIKSVKASLKAERHKDQV